MSKVNYRNRKKFIKRKTELKNRTEALSDLKMFLQARKAKLLTLKLEVASND